MRPAHRRKTARTADARLAAKAMRAARDAKVAAASADECGRKPVSWRFRSVAKRHFVKKPRVTVYRQGNHTLQRAVDYFLGGLYDEDDEFIIRRPAPVYRVMAAPVRQVYYGMASTAPSAATGVAPTARGSSP